ncbi:hypothetical protein DCPSUM001_13970 [Dysgonomonas capnocytophagoides]|nr:hypothetical protein DCPSUM001_13970 [Dysgonomonas capnocytophagoides]
MIINGSITPDLVVYFDVITVSFGFTYRLSGTRVVSTNVPSEGVSEERSSASIAFALSVVAVDSLQPNTKSKPIILIKGNLFMASKILSVNKIVMIAKLRSLTYFALASIITYQSL